MEIIEFYAKISAVADEVHQAIDMATRPPAFKRRASSLTIPTPAESPAGIAGGKVQASAHLQLEAGDIRQLGMREWDRANRQCAEGGDSHQREGDGHQGAA
jgi:hypothetical protein